MGAHAVDLRSSAEELVEARVEQRLLLGVGRQVARLLLELAPHRQRDGLARIHHAARQRPVARVLALDGHHLQLVRPRRVEARDDRVGRVVWPPLAQKTAALHARPPARVQGCGATIDESDGALERLSARPVDRRVSRLRCAIRGRGKAAQAWQGRRAGVACEGSDQSPGRGMGGRRGRHLGLPILRASQ